MAESLWASLRRTNIPPAGWTATRLRHQAGQVSRVEPPAFLMERALLLVGQAAVSQPEQRAGSVGREGDLDGCRARCYLGVALPAPGHDQPVRRIDHFVLADRDMFAVHVEAESTTGSRIDLRR